MKISFKILALIILLLNGILVYSNTIWTIPLKLSDIPMKPFSTYCEANTGIHHVIAGSEGKLFYFRAERDQNHAFQDLSNIDLYFEESILINETDALHIFSLAKKDEMRSIYMASSLDKGITWTQFRNIISNQEESLLFSRFSVFITESGRMFAFYTNEHKSAIKYATKPKGSEIWSSEYILASDSGNMLELMGALQIGSEKSPKILCYFYSKSALVITTTQNAGVTWTNPEPIIEIGRDHIIHKEAKRLYLIYEIPFVERQINEMKFSEDDGETWSRSFPIADFPQKVNASILSYKAYKRTPVLVFWTSPVIKIIDTINLREISEDTPFLNIQRMRISIDLNSTSFEIGMHAYYQYQDNFLYYSHKIFTT